MTDWDQRFLDLAAHYATWSKDPSTKVGCVIVNSDRVVIGSGYNGFPRGVKDTTERYDDRLQKLKMVVHSEANAILNSIVTPKHATLYCTQFPCTDCTKLIIQSGIHRVVTPRLLPDSRWAADAEWSRVMFSESLTIVTELT